MDAAQTEVITEVANQGTDADFSSLTTKSPSISRGTRSPRTPTARCEGRRRREVANSKMPAAAAGRFDTGKLSRQQLLSNGGDDSITGAGRQ